MRGLTAPETALVETILVVDTDLGFVAYLCSTLTKTGYRALPATTAQEARAVLQELAISDLDVLVASLQMPGGFQLARMLSRKGVKIVAIEGRRRSEFHAFQIAATLRRSDVPSPIVEWHWLRRLRSVLSRG